MRRRTAGLCLILATMFFPLVASAQVWLEDRQEGEGPGFKLGDSLVLHMGLGVEGGADSNALYTNVPQPAGRLRITSFVDLATRSAKRLEKDKDVKDATPPKATFRLGVAGFYDRYFSKDNGSVQRLNTGGDPFGLDVHLNYSILPLRKFTFFGDAIYIKTMEPYESNTDAKSKHQVAPSAGFRITPGGGTLSFETRYRLNLSVFANEGRATDSNKVSHEASILSSWRVFPKTVLLSIVKFAPTIYYEEASENRNSMPVRSMIGMQGLFTNRFGIKLLGGYGASFYELGPNFEGIIATAEMMFYVSPTAQIRLGAQRDFVDSYYSNFYVNNGGYVSYRQTLWGRLMVSLRGNIFYRKYAQYNGTPDYVPRPTSFRTDVWITTSLLVEYRASDWLAFFGSGRIWADITDFYFDPITSNTDIYAQFNKFEAFAGVRVHY